MNCIDCSYSLIKDGHSKCTYEEGECIKISLLEKENAELERKLEQTEKDLADYQFNYPTIKELQEENAELKEEVKNNEDLATVAYMQGAESQKKKSEEQLSRAREILRSLYFIIQGRIDYENDIGIADEMWRAKQFFKEV